MADRRRLLSHVGMTILQTSDELAQHANEGSRVVHVVEASHRGISQGSRHHT
jgi:hypothetical protein